MYRVSEQFITAIKNNARYIKCYFTLNGTEYNPITITIDNNIYSSDKDAFVGTFIGKSGSIKVRANDNLDLENKDIQLYFGIKLNDDTIEYVPQGSYRVYEKTSNTEYKICDHKIFFNEKINTKEVPFPTTVEKLATWVGKKLNIDVIIPTDFPNRNLTIPSEIFFGYDATYANVVEAITQATCTFAQINRSGQLEFRWFKKVDFSIDIENLPKGYPVLSKVLDPINSVVLAREPQNDNVYWPETVEDTRSEFKISNNPILDIDRYTSRMDIYDRMNSFSYIPVSILTQGFFHLDTGDIVSLQTKDGSYIDMLIMNHSLKYSGGISSQFETPALSKTMIDYSIASSIESHMYRTELEVDKVKNEIRAEIQEIDEKFQQIDITYYHAELTYSGTSITRDNSSITMSVQLLDKSDEVTTSDSAFNWKRVSSNAESDTAWNNAHKARKSITITSRSLEASANFYCDVSAAEWQGSTSAVTVVDEVKSQVPIGMLTPNLPTTQTLDENGKVTPVWGLTLIPSMTFGIFSPDIAEITTVWKRRINNDPLTDLTAKEVVKDNVLTVTGDILSESVRSVTYYCYMQYEYSTCMAEKTFTLVKDGSSGTDGISIVSTATMYAVNNSDEVSPTTGWITSRPERATGQYLWRKLRITYSDGTTTELEAECVTGDKGDAGKGIKSYAITYQASSSGTTAPTGTWTSTIPAVQQGQYLWSRTITTYTDNTTSTAYSVSYIPVNGTSVSVKSTSVTYQVSTNGTTAPTGTWSSTIPTVPKGQFLWTRTIVTYTDDKSTTAYSISYQPTNGANGTSVTVSSTKTTYQASSSGTTPPTGTWSDNPVAGSAGQYIWTRTIVTYSDGKSTTSYSISRNGTNGATGATGTSTASTVQQYFLSTSKVNPVGGTWTTTPPTWSAGKYLWTRFCITYKNPASTEYTVPVCDSSWEAVNEIEVGGRNLLQGTKNFKKGLSTGTLDTEIYKGFSVAYKDNSAGTTYSDVVYYTSAIDVEANTYYTLSFYAKGSGSLTSYFYPSNVASGMSSEGKTTTAADGSISHTLTTDWKRYWITWKTSSTTTGLKNVLPMRLSAKSKGYICGIMFSKGNVAIDWNSATEDVQEDINNAVNNATNQINTTIKTTNERIDTLNSSVQKISETVTKTSKDLEETSNKLLTIESTVNEHKTSITKISTIENTLTGKVDKSELEVYMRFYELLGSPHLEFGASTSTTKNTISNEGSIVTVNGIAQTIINSSGLIANNITTKRISFDYNHSIYTNSHEQLVIQ